MMIECGAALPAAVRRASLPAAPRARRPRDSRQDAGATVATSPINCGQRVAAIMPPSAGNAIFSRETTP